MLSELISMFYLIASDVLIDLDDVFCSVFTREHGALNMRSVLWRICLATPEETMSDVLQRLKRFHRRFIKEFPWAATLNKNTTKHNNDTLINYTVSSECGYRHRRDGDLSYIHNPLDYLNSTCMGKLLNRFDYSIIYNSLELLTVWKLIRKCTTIKFSTYIVALIMIINKTYKLNNIMITNGQ